MVVARGSRRTALAICASLLLTITSGCGTDEADQNSAQQVRLYGSDGNMQTEYVDALKGHESLLNGMKGTRPMTPLPDDFKNRLLKVDSELKDFLYSAEAYDAIMISALAAQLAGSVEPAEIAPHINGVTNQGRRCSAVTVCLDLARAGTDIEYRGISINQAGFTEVGEPSTASYATLHFDDGKLNDAKTEFVGAGDESTASTKAPPKPTKNARSRTPLKIGGLLPRTGDLAMAYPPLAAGATLAIKEINAAGGVLGRPIVWIDGDDGTNPEVAKATVASHVANGVHIILGAGASGISRAVLPDVIAAGRILFSPSNTDAGLTSVEDQGLYFRTAAPDILQGRALTDVILRDGSQKIALVARGDSYGEGLQDNVRTELERAGIAADRIKLLTYDPPKDTKAPPIDFTAGAQEIKEFGADAVLIIGFSESAQVILALADAHVQFR